jgi:beta-phosphoglucomutase-like phosphatase (HAD superfamily)
VRVAATIPSVEKAGRVDLATLVGAWRMAFHAADRALRAAGQNRDLDASELSAESRRLADERNATVNALGSLATELHTRPFLVRLVTSPWESLRLLGLPAGITGCVFNLDGVLVASAEFHGNAWKEIFEEFLSSWSERSVEPVPGFSFDFDYPRFIHGRSRENAVRELLASRGISLPEGRPDDEPGAQTVWGLANRKVRVLRQRLDAEPVRAYFGARLYLELAHDAGLGCAVVSQSTLATMLLAGARLADLVDECIDGVLVAEQGLKRKPAPDMLVAACRSLGVEPFDAAAFETRSDGVRAARAGQFAFVVALAEDEDVRTLRDAGADVVVADLGELVERGLAS